MAALGQKQPFDPGLPNVRFAPVADILPTAISLDDWGVARDQRNRRGGRIDPMGLRCVTVVGGSA